MNVEISIPEDTLGTGQNLEGTVTLLVTAQPNPNYVEFYIDNVFKGRDYASPWSYSWDTRTVSDGTHIIRAEAVYNKRRSKVQLAVTVLNGTTLPAPSNVPIISGFTPTTGLATTSVTINGSYFTGATSVLLGTVSCSFSVVNDSTITVTVPSGAVTGAWKVATPNGTATSQASFTVGTSSSPTGIYWGGGLEGDETYGHYYPGGPPGGGAWLDAPWGNTGNTWDRFESNAGKTVSLISWSDSSNILSGDASNFGTGPTTPASLCWARGAIPHVNVNTGSVSQSAIVSGTYDSQITAWANGVRNFGKPVFVRLDWEMNLEGGGLGSRVGVFPWGTQALSSPATFKAMWQHIVNLCNAAGATNISWHWCPGNYDDSYGARIDFGLQVSDFYPGDAYVDWVGVDLYSSNPSTLSFKTQMDKDYTRINACSAAGKPMMLGEFGVLGASSSGSDYTAAKASWFTTMLTSTSAGLKAYPNIKAFSWFNWWILESFRKQYPIESCLDFSSSATISAWASGIADSYYKSKFTSVPAFGKVPIPA